MMGSKTFPQWLKVTLDYDFEVFVILFYFILLAD